MGYAFQIQLELDLGKDEGKRQGVKKYSTTHHDLMARDLGRSDDMADDE